MGQGDWIVLALLGTILVKEGNCLKCYTCSSKLNDTCGDPKLHAMVPLDCTKDAMSQLKTLANRSNVPAKIEDAYDTNIEENVVAPFDCIKQVTKGTQTESDTILRGCQIAFPNFCKKFDSMNNVTCSTCNSDKCNFANYKGSSKWITTLSMMIIPLVAFLNY